MGVETERKFLIDHEAMLAAKRPTKILTRSYLTQGYLAKDPWVRIRFNDDHQAWITVKGPGAPVSPEWEYRIPYSDAQEMYALCKGKLSKIRRFVDYIDHVWHVDEFQGNLKGFWLAEIELKSLDDAFPRPPWVGEEVTGDPRYSNGWLVENGIPPRGGKSNG